MADPADPPQEGTPADPPTEDPPADDPPRDPADPPKAPDDPRVTEANKEAAKYRTRLREAEKALETAKTQGATELETAVATAKAEARLEALTEANERIVEAEVLAAAARKLADPADAARLLDLSQFQVDDKGSVDRKAISEAVEALLKDKPYLAGSRDPDFGARPPAGKDASGDMDAWLRTAARK